MDDEDRPARRLPEAGPGAATLGAASLLAGESLDSFSLDELDARIRLLEDEIARTGNHRLKATANLRDAEALFRRKPS